MQNSRISISDYSELGKTGVKIPPFAVGGWEFGGPPAFPRQDDKESIKIIRSAIEMGVNFFDTAESYGDGHSETIIGEAIHESGKDVIISTKHSTTKNKDFRLSAASVQEAVEGSLKRLRRDYIDIYFVHWPSSDIQLKDVMDGMTKLKGQGKLRAIGVSNFQLNELKMVRQHAAIDVLQPPYSLLWRCLEDDVFHYCSENGIPLIVYSPLAFGILTSAFIKNGRRSLSETQGKQVLLKEPYFHLASSVLDVVEEIAQKYKCTISQVAIAWMLERRNVAAMILGIEKLTYFTENIMAMNLRIDPGDLSRLEKVSEPLQAAHHRDVEKEHDRLVA